MTATPSSTPTNTPTTPANDFPNWSIIDAGTFDYAADAWGTTYGAAVDQYQDRFAARFGLFDLSSVPNSIALSLPLFHQTQFVAELEEQHTIWDRPGKLKLLYRLSRGKGRTGADHRDLLQPRCLPLH
jgi:high affinity Mn2+ porin